MKTIAYEQVRKDIFGKTAHLLLGNGFSIGCDPVFEYPSLYKEAKKNGLGSRVQALFRKLGTNNFEGVMRLLNDSHWVAKEYGLIAGGNSDMLKDKEGVKKALISAVASTHLDHAGCIAEERKASALKFLQDYHNIFTTNYDLLLYWIVMHSGKPTFQDGFRDDPDDPSSLIFSERLGGKSGIFFLHGALHLFHHEGKVKKHSWKKTGKMLTAWVREGLERDQYPLFVAEGDHEKKLEQIQRSSYLGYCLGKLTRITGPLVILGHSLSKSDSHIIHGIVNNFDLRKIYIGLQDPESPNGLAIQKVGAEMKRDRLRLRKTASLDIFYFDSQSAHVWNLPK